MTTKIHNSNTACCSIPPVRSSYEPKGSFKAYAGFSKTYQTGPEGTSRALIAVYDIFGFWPQTQQGADILAETLQVRVIMPDFFEPDAAFPMEYYPPDTTEKKAAIQAFFGGPAKMDKTLPNVKKVGDALRADGYKNVGVYGYCWGGKVATLTGADSSFDAVAAIHPAMLDASDAKSLAVPLGLFPSKDEPIAEYEKLVKAISDKPFASRNAYKLYPTVHHGWAAARADLSDPENKKQYEDLYGTLAGFFQGVWA
ncbi:alpha/beta-hydrolase [Hysterangium stoloniferum]|nr:alpha/beta-hydrolase [Hysterangium stoloniferum]